MRLDLRLLLMALLVAPWGGGAGAAAARDATSECRAASVAQVLTGDEGDCFAVTGVAIDGLLMDDGQHIYAQPRLYNDPSSSGVQLGLTGWSDDEGLKGAAHLRVTGMLRRCAAESGGNLLPEGAGAFCERHRGLYLDVKQAVTLGRAAIRRGVRADGAGLGNLVPVSEYAIRHSMMQVWGVLQRRLSIMGAERLRMMLPEPRPSRLAVDAALQRDSKLEILGWRAPAWADAAAKEDLHQQGAARAEVIACAMSATAAQDLWPISTRDIGVAADRPYLCVRLIEAGEDSQPPEGGQGANIQYVDGVIVEYLVDENPAVEG